MADGSLLLIYRSLTTEDLQTRKAAILNQVSSFSSMGVGTKSFTRDLRHAQNQLEAIIFVLNERNCPYEGVVLTDFSIAPIRSQPSGTLEPL